MKFPKNTPLVSIYGLIIKRSENAKVHGGRAYFIVPVVG